MADQTPRERLQPALLDRLTDDAPQRTQESVRERVIDLERLRASVIRDLSWLLNSGWMNELDDFEEQGVDVSEVRDSVLNYGIAHLEGKTASTVQARDLERMLLRAIKTFEPRILPDTLQVRAVLTKGLMNRNAVSFEIQGQLWAHPVPLALLLRTELDLETGHVELEEGPVEG
jgi:type VI secretion system protein ImpF